MSNIDRIDSVTTGLQNRKPTQGSIQTPELNEEIKSKRPKNTALKQQRLPAWQPILTASTVLPLFFIVGFIFIALGGVLLYYSSIVKEYVINYTDCISDQNSSTCATFAQVPLSNCTCTIRFKLDKSFTRPVYMYYGLRNFYQNHRRYVKSRDDNQLLGKKVTKSSINSDCAPYDFNNESLIYAPCGAIANSLFNDSFELRFNGQNNDSNLIVPLIRTGIAWSSDKSVKFGVPATFNGTIKPPNWPRPVQELDLIDESNNGYKNEDLIVWMRTAALPNFRKLYRRIDHSSLNFSNGLPNGYYTVKINYNFPVKEFDGEKRFILSTSTWIGGKNPFLGIAYLVIGILCVVLGFIFLVIHMMFAKKINEEYNALKSMANR